VVIIALVLALVATLYPSWRASRIDPAEALRHE
jgi:lipoprotein-releasing system permease protein